MVIVAIAFLSMATVVPNAFGYASRDSQRVQAVAAGQIYLDQLRYHIASNGSTSATPAPPVIAVDPGDSFVVNGTAQASVGNFAISSLCPLASGSLYRWDCTVSVTWNDPTGHGLSAANRWGTWGLFAANWISFRIALAPPPPPIPVSTRPVYPPDGPVPETPKGGKGKKK